MGWKNTPLHKRQQNPTLSPTQFALQLITLQVTHAPKLYANGRRNQVRNQAVLHSIPIRN